MKTVGIVVGCLAVLLIVLRITGFGPHGRTPGLWLSGELVTTPVTDWSFTDKVQNVQLQTNTWYGIPHSVNINCSTYKGQLYLDSFYPAGLTYPHGRSWNENIARDPHVRIRIGNKLYDRTLVLVTDPALKEAVDELKLKKYPDLKLPPGGTIVLFHVVDNS
ncbi:MAG TPA: hypothetical protein VKT49_10660 [Bryobacteraceae bacterium]|nr:hypothetical protein [Bryobacteraceae bacterium]